MRSRPLKNGPESFAESMDREIIRTAYHRSLEANWDILKKVPRGAYVVCHPEDFYKAYRQSGITPFVSKEATPGKAIIGFKESNYHASLYYIGYVPFDQYLSTNPDNFVRWILTKTRYNISVPPDFINPCNERLKDMRPDLWTVNV